MRPSYIKGENGSGIQGPNGVTSMLHDCLFRFGYGEKGCVMHSDNCAGTYNLNLIDIYFCTAKIIL